MREQIRVGSLEIPLDTGDEDIVVSAMLIVSTISAGDPDAETVHVTSPLSQSFITNVGLSHYAARVMSAQVLAGIAEEE